MILFDTNIWIQFFKGKREGETLQKALLGETVVMHPYIKGELLLGGINVELEILIDALPILNTPNYSKILDFIKSKRIEGIGWVDSVLLFCALENQAKLKTLDKKLNIQYQTLTNSKQ
ncbi:MAG: PIN domain-containing protein [Leptospiraceae bacterium]|nr:PIN domain-containing protein [Leptospiraceae bacterium]